MLNNMADSLIKLQDVWKTYKLGKVDLTVLKEVSLEINPGSFVTIMGPSGSGKSTLMYLIGLLDVPSKGQIFLEGKDISDFSENELAELRGKKIGFVFQQFNLIHNLSAKENIMLPMIFQGTDREKREKRARELLKLVGLKERADHRPNELSGGEQQRVAVARSLVNNPEIIIADEPTGNLDSKTGKIIMKLLSDLHKDEKKTIVVVTHDPNIAQYSQNIINISDGEVVKNHKSAEEVLWKQ